MTSDSLYIGAGALQAFSVGMQVSAHNLANCSTQEFAPQRVSYGELPERQGMRLRSVSKETIGALPPDASGTEIAKELSTMLISEHAFAANAKTVACADEMTGSLLNTIA